MVLLLQTVVHVLCELEERVGDVWAEHARVGLGAGLGAGLGYSSIAASSLSFLTGF